MNKETFIRACSKHISMPQTDIERVYDGFVSALCDGLQEDGEVRLINIGIFRKKIRPARKGRNPRTGEEILIPAKEAISFTPWKSLQEKIAAA